MTVIPFDTFKVAAARRANVRMGQGQAEGAAKAPACAESGTEMVTKADIIAVLKDIDSVKAEVKSVRGEIQSIKDQMAALKAEMTMLKAERASAAQMVEREFKTRLDATIVVVASLFLACFA